MDVMPDAPLPQCIVVGLDGSSFGERSLPVASDLAEALGADLKLLSVVESPLDWTARAAYLADVHQRYRGDVALLLERDVRNALAHRLPGELLCLATHGRSAVMRSLLGSVAFAEIAAGRPALLVGASGAGRDPDGPVVVPVGGGVDYDESLDVAAAWATKLGVDVVVVTATSRPVPGTEPDADRAVATLGALGVRAAAAVLDVVDDPVAALARWSRHQPSSLFVATSAIDSGQPRALLHSHMADLVGRVRAPVLIVPSREGHE